MGPPSSLPGQRRGRTHLAGSSSSLCRSENEWKAELRNRTERIRLDMLLLQLNREQHLEEKRLSVALRHMNAQAEGLQRRKTNLTHYQGIKEKRKSSASAISRQEYGAFSQEDSFFLTNIYPNYLMELSDGIPQGHDHPGGERDENCSICLQISKLITDYMQWKETMAIREKHKSLQEEEPDASYKDHARSRGPMLSQPYLAREGIAPRLSQSVVFNQGGSSSGLVGPYDGQRVTSASTPKKHRLTKRPMSQGIPISHKTKDEQSLQEYLGQDPGTSNRLQSFLNQQEQFNRTNPVPRRIKLETEHAHTHAQPPSHLLESKSKTHISKSRMISEALKQLDLQPQERYTSASKTAVY